MHHEDPLPRRGLWALVLWSLLLLWITASHQPPYQSQFAEWARYVTTREFLWEHLLGSVLGAGIGALGFVALAARLRPRAPRLASVGLSLAILGNTLLTAVFGIAAFAQPAIGRAFLAGHDDVRALYDDVNGPPLMATALLGMLGLSVGLVLFGIALLRTRLAPRLAAYALVIGGPLFAIVGVILADVVQSLGAFLLVVGTAWTAGAARRGG